MTEWRVTDGPRRRPGVHALAAVVLHQGHALPSPFKAGELRPNGSRDAIGAGRTNRLTRKLEGPRNRAGDEAADLR